jgi:hypothetical protein
MTCCKTIGCRIYKEYKEEHKGRICECYGKLFTMGWIAGRLCLEKFVLPGEDHCVIKHNLITTYEEKYTK